MSELLHEFRESLRREDGTLYRVRALGCEREDGTWEGWLEFEPEDPLKAVLVTERETTQPNREAAVYWATGLEPVYFDGALERAVRLALEGPVAL